MSQAVHLNLSVSHLAYPRSTTHTTHNEYKQYTLTNELVELFLEAVARHADDEERVAALPDHLRRLDARL